MTEVRRKGHIVFNADDNGCRSSLTDDNGVMQLRAVVVPEIKGDMLAQTDSAIERIDVILKREQMVGAVVNQTVFLREVGDRQVVRQRMIEYYGDNLPATTFVPQKPCDGSALTVELYAVASKTTPVTIKRVNEWNVTLEYHGITFDYVGDIVPDRKPVGSYARSYNGFEVMEKGLADAGFTMNDLFRTWLYQGHITLREADTQRYKELNRARSDYYEPFRFFKGMLPPEKKGYICPASTGIGTDDVDIVMTVFAAKKTGGEIVAVPLENPGQVPAFDYGECYSPSSPKFARALAYLLDDNCAVLVSGTASITDSETVFKGDPAGQANQTLDNIAMLIAGDNIAAHGVRGFGADLQDAAVARVYVKKREQFDTIKAVCDKRFGNAPIVYTFADVCRDDLLVEIEGVFSCQRK